MRNGGVVRSSTAQTTRFSASSAIVARTDSALSLSTAEGATIATAAAVLLCSDRVGRFPLTRTAARAALSTGTRKQLVLGGLEATRGLAPPAAAPEPPPPANPPGEEPAEPPQEVPAAAVKPAKPRPIEMTIDSLPNYDLLQPIPVVIEALDDRMFAAAAPALEISTTGSSVGGAFLQLKEQIAATYEQCRQKNSLAPERLHQIGLFQAYIGKAKRGWSIGRG